jgi:hypothetical protein
MYTGPMHPEVRLEGPDESDAWVEGNERSVGIKVVSAKQDRKPYLEYR